jgi:general stress protein YciG
VRVAFAAVADQRDASVIRGDVGHERRRAETVVHAGVAKNRMEQSLALPSPGTERVRQRAQQRFRGDGFQIMSTTENSANGGGMSVREAGKRGGDRVKEKYGSEFYEAIGRKGGEATKSKYGPTFYEEIGSKGGQKPKRSPADA